MGRVGWSLGVVARDGPPGGRRCSGRKRRFGIPMPLVLAAAAGVALFVRSRPARTIELGWSGGTAVIDAGRRHSAAARGPRRGAAAR